MNFLKRLETELTVDWATLQQETNQVIKAIALKAYYIKYRAFKKSQAWDLELQTLLA